MNANEKYFEPHLSGPCGCARYVPASCSAACTLGRTAPSASVRYLGADEEEGESSATCTTPICCCRSGVARVRACVGMDMVWECGCVDN